MIVTEEAEEEGKEQEPLKTYVNSLYDFLSQRFLSHSNAFTKTEMLSHLNQNILFKGS